MDRQAFRNRMQLLKLYRELNPGKTYLDFKKYADGGLTDKDWYNSLTKELKNRIVSTSPTISDELARSLANTYPSTVARGLLSDVGSFAFDAGELPLVDIKPTQMYAVLNTYYPFISRYSKTGHSELITPAGRSISTGGADKNYNLFCNNCSDATGTALLKAFNKKLDTNLFTTPGDVKDFAETLGGIYSSPNSRHNKKGTKTQFIPVNIDQARELEFLADSIYRDGEGLPIISRKEFWDNINSYAKGGELEASLPEITVTAKRVKPRVPGNITSLVLSLDMPTQLQPNIVDNNTYSGNDLDEVNIVANRVNKQAPNGIIANMVRTDIPRVNKLRPFNSLEQPSIIDNDLVITDQPERLGSETIATELPFISNDLEVTDTPDRLGSETILGDYGKRRYNSRYTSNFLNERDWLANFATERSKLPEFADLLDTEQLTAYLDRIYNTPVLVQDAEVYSGPRDSGGVTVFNTDKDVDYAGSSFYDTGAGIKVMKDPTAIGNMIEYSRNLPSNVLHELEHSGQISTRPSMYRKEGFSKRVLKTADILGYDLDTPSSEYTNNPWEVLARRQLMFNEMNADPTKKYTKKDLKSIRSYLKKYDLNHLGDDKILRLLNDVASVDSRKGDFDIPMAAEGGEIPPSNKPVIPEEPQPYKGKLYKDRYGRKYTEDQLADYYDNSTDEIDRFTGKPFIRGLKPVGDLEDAANVTPVGDAISAYGVYNAIKNSDWEGAGLAALGMVPFMPSLGGVARTSKKVSKPKNTYIPKVNPNYKQNVIDRALLELKNYSDMPLSLVEEINDQRNRTYDLMQEPYVRERAKAIDHQYGTDYLKVYDSMLEKYVNIDEYFKLPEPKYKKMERPTIGALVTPSKGNTMYFNRDMIKTPLDIPNNVVLHEMGHLVDGATGMNNEFLRKLGDKSKFIPFNQARTMYPTMTKEMYDNILQGTEIKSYMNLFRNYLDLKGKLNKGNYTGSYKNLKKEIIEAPRESFNNIKAIFNLYRSPKVFNKDFQMIPIVNNTNNNILA